MSAVFMGLWPASTHAIPEMASGAMARRHRLERRHLAHAAVGLKWAARMEMAARRRVERARRSRPWPWPRAEAAARWNGSGIAAISARV